MSRRWAALLFGAAVLAAAACKPSMQRRSGSASGTGTAAAKPVPAGTPSAARPAARARKASATPTPTPTPTPMLRAAMWRFDRVALGSLPAGMRKVEGRWRVAKGRKGRVLAHEVGGSSAAPEHLMLVTMGRFGTVSVSARIRATAEKKNVASAGVVWRASAKGDSYYGALLDTTRRKLSLVVRSGGKRRVLASARVAVAKAKAKAWRLLHASMKDGRIVCSVDGKKVIERRDTTLSARGHVGVVAAAAASATFDDLSLRSLE